MLAVVVLALSAGRTGHIAKDSYLQDGADRYACDGGNCYSCSSVDTKLEALKISCLSCKLVTSIFFSFFFFFCFLGRLHQFLSLLVSVLIYWVCKMIFNRIGWLPLWISLYFLFLALGINV